MTQYSSGSLIIFLCTLLTIIACKEKSASLPSSQNTSQYKTEIEDEKAAKIVESMMLAMGGEKNWNDLKYVSWTFFGARHLVWDKMGGRVRIDSPRDTSIYLVNLHDHKGKIIKSGQEVTDPEELDQLIKRGESIWINDSYWLFMPFKLQDPGVTVTYMREDTMKGGIPSSVLELTFDSVGDTPGNKYEIYVDHRDSLIKQWAFFKDANQETPPRIWPWDHYQSHNGLLLSSERSDSSGPSNVRIYDTLDDIVFESFEPFEY